jgi:hypothetical protein
MGEREGRKNTIFHEYSATLYLEKPERSFSGIEKKLRDKGRIDCGNRCLSG